MKKKNELRASIYSMGICMVMMLWMVGFNSCSNSGKTADESKAVDDEAFYQTQPVHSGLYDADYYTVTGANERKGHFDGRIFFSLSPETSALYVFENGNRTKIDHVIELQHPFEKNDRGLYVSTDAKDRAVTVNTDSAQYVLNFQRSGEDYSIKFSPKPRYTGTAVEIMEKMAAQKQKSK